jgi:hypothetical protein
LEETELIENIKLALNPKVSYWVLFSNGTVIVFDVLTKGENINEKAIKHMRDFGPVWPASEAADFGIVNLVSTKGWFVTGHGYGMYTYVHPQEVSNNPRDVEIGVIGRSKRHKDSQELKIIHVNNSTTLDGGRIV